MHAEPHLALGELPEHGSQTVVVHVAVGFDGHVEDVDGLLPGALQGQGDVPIKSGTNEHPQPSGQAPYTQPDSSGGNHLTRENCEGNP